MMNSDRYVNVIAGCLVLVAQTLQAQFQPGNLIKHWSIKDGLSQSVVNSMVQDDQSLMWFATEDGLNRFDGYSFRSFKYDQYNRKGLPDNFIQCLFKDSDKTLWVSSRKGLLKFDPNTESFALYRHGDKLRRNDVSYITEGAAKNLWVAWYGNGFASFNKQTCAFTPYTASAVKLSGDKAVALLEDRLGLLWVGTQDGGLNVFNVSNGLIVKKIEVLSDLAQLPSLNIKCMAEDGMSNIWIGTTKGLVVYIRQQNKFFTFNHSKFAVAEKRIFSLQADSNDNLWIGTQGEGLYHLDLRQGKTRSAEDYIFSSIASLDDYDISKRTIQSLYEDLDKNIWVGTFADGFYLVSSVKEKFIKMQKLLHKGSSVSFADYYGMCYDHEGSLWLGTDGNGIYKTDINGKHEKNYLADGRPGSIGDNAIVSALCDSNDRLWFGTYSKGIFQYNRASDSFISYPHKSPGQQKAGAFDVRVLFEDSKKRIWAGTNRGGLCLLNQESGSYSNPVEFSGPLKDGDVRSIAEDRDGYLWIGFYGDGLYRYDHKTKVAEPFFREGDKRGQLQSDFVFALNTDRQNRLWIGTGGGGFYCFEPQNNMLRRFTEKEGLANNTIYAILIDNSENCWLSTNIGISKFHTPTKTFTNYEPIDGLQEGQFNMGSALYNSVAGYMCFGGTLGYNIFYPDRMDEKLESPPIMISGLRIFNKPVSLNDSVDGEPLLKQVISKEGQIVLNHDQSVITLEFIGLDYSYPEKNNYAYKLEGLDDNWNFVGHQRSATYRYLAPGDYTFKVKASKQENFWSNEFASLKITVKPPFWRTPLAYTLYFFIVLVSGLVMYRIASRQLMLRRKLKATKAQRKHERQMAKEKLTFFTEISHEFRTPLTLIMGPLEEMLSKEEGSSAASGRLKMVYRNASKLLTLINKLLDYRKLEGGNVFLKVREDDIVSFVEDVFTTFKELASHKNITFGFYAEQPSVNAWFDKEKMEMIVTNIISNSFKYIGEGNEIAVTVSVQASEKLKQDMVVIQVKDNGIGISPAHLKDVFNWFYKSGVTGHMSSGIGLSLAQKLVHLHKGDIEVESEEGKGSVFSIKIPLGKDHFNPGEVVVADMPKEASTHQATHNLDEGGTTKKGSDTVLIIEDDEEIRGFLKEYFEKKYRILEAKNGSEALELATHLHPDLIISDIMMPGIDGFELCRQIKNNMRTSHIPVILLTAKTSLTHHKEGMETGADAYITKPFSPEILSLTVHNLLRSRDNQVRFYRNLFMNHSDSVANKPGSPDEKFLHTIYEQLEANLDKPDFNINVLCDELNMSRSLVYKKVKMLTGLSPVEYVRSLRMQEAAKLLKSRQYKVYEVVNMVGFSDPKYFRKSFTREFGVSPSDYLRQIEVSKP